MSPGRTSRRWSDRFSRAASPAPEVRASDRAGEEQVPGEEEPVSLEADAAGRVTRRVKHVELEEARPCATSVGERPEAGWLSAGFRDLLVRPNGMPVALDPGARPPLDLQGGAYVVVVTVREHDDVARQAASIQEAQDPARLGARVHDQGVRARRLGDHVAVRAPGSDDESLDHEAAGPGCECHIRRQGPRGRRRRNARSSTTEAEDEGHDPPEEEQGVADAVAHGEAGYTAPTAIASLRCRTDRIPTMTVDTPSMPSPYL